MFTGAGLQMIVDDRDGVIVVAGADSPLRLSLTELMKRAQPHHRALIGAVILALARTAYPEPSMLDDPDRVAVFTTQSVVDALDRAVQNQADRSSDDGDADDDRVEIWRRWQALSEARPNARRRSPSDRSGVVNRVCRLMSDAGYLTARSEIDGGTWLARPRLRHAVGALTVNSNLYALVNGLSEQTRNGLGGETGADGQGAE
jgi:hypothetical protein